MGSVLDVMFRGFDRTVPGKEEMYGLIERAQSGDIDARNEAIVRNMKLVVMVVKQMKHPPQVSMEDMIQEGVFGLVRAIDLFDLSSGYAFGTYAVQCIRRVTGRMVDRDTSVVRLPPAFRRYLRDDHRLKGKILPLLGGNVSLDGRDAQACIPPDLVVEENDVGAVAVCEEEIDMLRKRVGDLPEKLRQVLVWRLEGVSLEDVGKRFAVSKERARQLEVKALRSLAEMYGFAWAGCTLSKAG